MSKWIPTSSLMPLLDDDGIDVLVYCDGEIGIAWRGWRHDEIDGLDRYGLDDFDGIAPHWHWSNGHAHVFPKEVTHWMPLPEPPTNTK